MFYVAAVLVVLSGLFYAASHHEIGTLGVEMCRYGSTFCDNPFYVLVGAILAAIWGAFVSIRYSDPPSQTKKLAARSPAAAARN